MNFDQFLEILWEQKPIGGDGFEGLIAKLLENFLGQRFYLSLSGRQEGRDMASKRHTGNALAVECKRYKDSTRLSSDELIAKFSSVSLDQFPPDTWMVVTTKRLGEQLHRQLEKFSYNLGISYFSIDAEGDEKSTLATLCATSPQLVADHLKNHQPKITSLKPKKVSKYLTGIASQSDFTEQSEHLYRDLTTDNIGYEHLRQEQSKWIINGFSTREESYANFGQDISVLGTTRTIIHRQHAIATLNDWFNNWNDAHKLLGILGEEGDGKSWAISDWLATNLKNNNLPLTLFIPSAQAKYTNPNDLITDTLSHSFPKHNREYWAKRIERWKNQSSIDDKPKILLVLDGINERHKFNWAELISRFSAQEWTGNIGIIITCRTVYWERYIKEKTIGSIQTWVLPPYNDTELAEALASKGIQRDEFTLNMLNLLSKPRYFDLMIQLRERVAESGDVTVERLIYEDFRDKLSHKQGNQTIISHEDFQDLITEIAEDIRDNHSIRRSDINRHLQGYNQDNTLLEELLSSRILEKTKSHWTVNRDNLILGLGVLLANEVWHCSEENIAAIDEIIAFHMEPHADMDLKVAICGMAVYHGMRIEEFPESGRLALFDAWISGRNIEEEGLSRLPAYLPMRPNTYINLAEYLWARDVDNRDAQDAMMAGFLRHGKIEKVHTTLVSAFERWFSFVHPDGNIGTKKDDEELEKSRQRVESALGDTPSPGVIIRYGHDLNIIHDEGLLRLARVALAIISHQERSPYIHALSTGVIARTIMGYVNFEREISWVLRTAPDTIEPLVLSEAHRLCSYPEKTAQRAAWWLLGYLRTAKALEQRDTIPREYSYQNPIMKSFNDNPCNAFLGSWTHDNYLQCVETTNLNASQIANMLQNVALDPAIQTNKNIGNLLQEIGSELPLDKISKFRGRTREELILEQAEPALCTFIPACSANIIRALAETLPRRTGTSLHLLSWRLYEHLLVLEEPARHAIESSWRSVIGTNTPDEEERCAENLLFTMVLPGKTPQQQMELVIERGEKCGHFTHYPPIYSQLENNSLERIELYLSTQIDLKDNTRAYNFLSYLTRSLQTSNTKVRAELLRIFVSGDSILRPLCLEIFVSTADEIAAKCVIDSGWSCTEQDTRLENYWGSLLLGQYGNDIPFSELADRVNLEFLGYAVEKRGSISEEIKAYGELLHSTWVSITKNGVPLPTEAANTFVYTDLISGEKLQDSMFVSEDSNTFHFVSWDSVWGGADDMNSKDISNAFDFQLREERLINTNKRIEKFVDQERRAGNPWLAYNFNKHALQEVVDEFPQVVNQWIRYATSPVVSNSTPHHVSPLRGFYTALCEVLLNSNQEQGVKLFEFLSEDNAFRITDRITGIESRYFSIFKANDSDVIHNLLLQMFDKITSDKELLDFVFLAEFSNHFDKLQQLTENLLDSDKPFDIARGVTVLGFMDNAWAGKRLNDYLEGTPNCWIRNVAEQANNTYKRNKWAKQHFDSFLNNENILSAWASFRLFLHCTDRRFWLWGPSINELEILRPEIQGHYILNKEFIKKAADKNEKDLKKRFIWQNIHDSQLWPWMGEYLSH